MTTNATARKTEKLRRIQPITTKFSSVEINVSVKKTIAKPVSTFAPRLPRNADHEWSIMRAKPLKLREQVQIVIERFPETNARIKRNCHGINITTYGARILLSKKIRNFRNDILILRPLLHCLGSSLHV